MSLDMIRADELTYPGSKRASEVEAVLVDPKGEFKVDIQKVPKMEDGKPVVENGEIVLVDEKLSDATCRVLGDIFTARLEKYADPASPEFKPFHGIGHTAEVVARGNTVFKDLRANAPWFLLNMTENDYEKLTEQEKQEKLDKEALYLRAFLLGHDVVQKGQVQSDGMLKRARGMEPENNEGASAKEIHDILQKVRGPDGKPMFEEYSLDRVRADVSVTYPNPIHPKLFLNLRQPFLTRESSAVAKIAAFVDTKMTSMPKNYIAKVLTDDMAPDVELSKRTGDAEWCELNPWVATLMERGWDTLTSADQMNLAQSAYKWLGTQSQFYGFQRDDLGRRLQMVPSKPHDLLVDEKTGLKMSEFKVDEALNAILVDEGIIEDPVALEVFERFFSPKRLQQIIQNADTRYKWWKQKIELDDVFQVDVAKNLVHEMYSHGYPDKVRLAPDAESIVALV